MLPYIIKAWDPESNADNIKPFSVSRPKVLPQAASLTDDGVLSCLYVDAHCQKGLEACKFLTPQVLPDAAKQLCLKIYRYITQNNPLNHRQQQS
ncbi:unnamed protein product [Eruca vesicaria subsp. sativa]|uniref:Uncharacterized protein n=1 Tax=Eruca vesicaria subsp. sativa TaxID=29727 RepID=A0ABC8LD92_ERUVS|nr:unnamed protein product [Eruca vesicaria subsp. sativa]